MKKSTAESKLCPLKVGSSEDGVHYYCKVGKCHAWDETKQAIKAGESIPTFARKANIADEASEAEGVCTICS